jgi:ATP-binding cassette subfamily F protein 3
MSKPITPSPQPQQGEVILRFSDAAFGYGHMHPILKGVNFSLRRGAKMTLMGQNGAGKSTIFQLITGGLKIEEGKIMINPGLTIATARQVIPRDQLELTIREFFEGAFDKKVYDIDPRIDKVLAVVNLSAPKERLVKTFSGGQQARLLLAFALIQDPDLLLLDEPTNNLDPAGIEHLTQFLVEYKKSCIVISHDADFLNAFTHGVFYLDVHSHTVEQYSGNYHDVVAEISRRIERERMKNVRLQRDIEHRKEQAGFFGQKGGHMRDVARKMREKIEELEEGVVEVRKEDKTIRSFAIPAQADLAGEIVAFTSLAVVEHHKAVQKKVKVHVKRGERLLLRGRNGIGKTTLLESIVNRTAKGMTIAPEVVIGYFRQDFSNLDFDMSTYDALAEVAREGTEEDLRSTAAGFLLGAAALKATVGALSEGQKGLLSFARLVLQKPGLLILDEPTNHMNFRHIPVIAEALDRYQGAMILVSHVPEFVKKIRIDHTLDLEKLLKD